MNSLNEIVPLNTLGLARGAYEAYADSVSLASGAQLAVFEALPEETRRAWHCAAVGVALATVADLKKRMSKSFHVTI